VDWVALAAFLNMKWIPRVTLAGAVKTSAQQKWSRIYREAYASRILDSSWNSFLRYLLGIAKVGAWWVRFREGRRHASEQVCTGL
jgi:hypothetical protein